MPGLFEQFLPLLCSRGNMFLNFRPAAYGVTVQTYFYKGT